MQKLIAQEHLVWTLVASKMADHCSICPQEEGQIGWVKAEIAFQLGDTGVCVCALSPNARVCFTELFK